MSPTIPVLAIPILNRLDLLHRCLVSTAGYPIDTIVLVNNSGQSNFLAGLSYAIFRRGPRIVVLSHPNAGVAGSWNEVVKHFPQAGWWLFAGNDIVFTEGDLEKIALSAIGSPDTVCHFANHGHSLFVLTERGVEKVGLFDENIYPAYLEDSDWMWRRHQLGEPYIDIPGVKALHGENGQGSRTINADPHLARQNIRTHAGNFDYYRRKWGGINGQEVFKTPFNDPHWPLDFWRYEPRRRAQQQWVY